MVCITSDHSREKGKARTGVFEVVSVLVREGLHVAAVVHLAEAELLGGSQQGAAWGRHHDDVTGGVLARMGQ